MEFLKFDKSFDRDDYLKGLSVIGDEIEKKNWKDFIALEIGTGWGNSANYMLDRFSNLKLLISVDINYELESIGELKNKFNHRFSSIQPDKFDHFLMRKFDYIYIDGGHTYEEVKSDILKYTHLLTDDGIIAFDDYGNPGHVCGVQQAVDELMDRSKFSKVIEVGNQTRIIIFVR